MPDFLPLVAMLLWLFLVVFVIFRIITWINRIIKNNDLYKDDMLTVLEEIREELKELKSSRHRPGYSRTPAYWRPRWRQLPMSP